MSDTENMISGVVVVVMVFFWVLFMVPMVWAHVRIIQKAGYSGWNILWSFVPVMNIVMFFAFAFSVWPIEKRLNYLEQTKMF